MMKICIVGFGSMGRRHLKNINKIFSDNRKVLHVDLLRRKTSNSNENIEGISQVYNDYEELPFDYDVIFITNPTNLHYSTIKKLAKNSRNMFIEKPIFDYSNYEIDDLNLNKRGVYYVACPLRYTNIIKWVSNFSKENKIFAARVICSSYLPSWRPGDYRKNYSAIKQLGGGVSIDLIHEWDYLYYIFGMPNRVCNSNGTYSDLEIDSDDISIYIAEYPDKLISVHLDYFGRQTRRELELYTSEETIIADLVKNEIRFLKENKIISFEEERDDYQINELKAFFDMVKFNKENTNSIETAIKVLKIAKGEM